MSELAHVPIIRNPCPKCGKHLAALEKIEPIGPIGSAEVDAQCPDGHKFRVTITSTVRMEMPS